MKPGVLDSNWSTETTWPGRVATFVVLIFERCDGLVIEFCGHSPCIGGRHSPRWHESVQVPKQTLVVLGVLVVEFWGLPPLILFFNVSIGWFGRFVLSTECYRTRKLGYKNLNWPRCSAWVTESLALTDGGFCQKQTLYISDYVNMVIL